MRCLIPFITSIFTVVFAQTPEGFAPEAPQSLQVTFENNNAVTPAGLLLDRSAVAKQPSIRLQNGTQPTGQFMQFIVDVDVPAQDGTRTTFLHLAQSDLNAAAANSSQSATNGTAQAATNSTAAAAVGPYANATSAATNNTGAVALASNSSRVEASYLQPSPPAGDGPHKYVVLLFAQPAGFSVPAQFANVLSTADTSPQARAGFDVNAFAQAAGLGVPIGGTFFTVENGSASGTGGSANSTGTASTNGTAAAAESSNSTATAAAEQASGTAAASFTGSASKQAPASILGLAVLIGAMSLGNL